jgi:peptidoglycan/LPS O-acetylase OafA/YrhL
LKPRLASAGAVTAGFLVTALASTAADAVMHAAGIFPSAPRLMSDPLFALASAYRALFTVAGGYVTARLAPDRPMRHAWILAGIGLVAGLAGVVAYYAIGGAELGPAWYAISIPVEAIPCVWLGGRLSAGRRPESAGPSWPQKAMRGATARGAASRLDQKIGLTR